VSALRHLTATTRRVASTGIPAARRQASTVPHSWTPPKYTLKVGCRRSFVHFLLVLTLPLFAGTLRALRPDRSLPAHRYRHLHDLLRAFPVLFPPLSPFSNSLFSRQAGHDLGHPLVRNGPDAEAVAEEARWEQPVEREGAVGRREGAQWEVVKRSSLILFSSLLSLLFCS
jgi:hypothetical protein